MIHLGLILVLVFDTALRHLAPLGLGIEFTPPSIAFVTALYIGFRARRSGQLGYAVLLGALVGALSSRGIGHFAFLYGLAAYFAWNIRRYLPPDAMVAYIVACLFCGTVVAAFGLVIAVITIDAPVGAGFGRSLLEVLFSSLVAPMIFSCLDRSRLFRGALGGREYRFA